MSLRMLLRLYVCGACKVCVLWRPCVCYCAVCLCFRRVLHPCLRAPMRDMLSAICVYACCRHHVSCRDTITRAGGRRRYKAQAALTSRARPWLSLPCAAVAPHHKARDYSIAA